MKRGLSQRFWKRWNRSLQNAGIGPSHHLKIFRLPTYFFHLPTTLASHFWSPPSLLQMFSSHLHFLSLSLSLFLNPFPLLLSSSLLKTHHFFSRISNTKILPKTTNPTQSKVSLSSSHFYFVAIFVYIYIYIYLLLNFWFFLLLFYFGWSLVWVMCIFLCNYWLIVWVLVLVLVLVLVKV